MKNVRKAIDNSRNWAVNQSGNQTKYECQQALAHIRRFYRISRQAKWVVKKSGKTYTQAQIIKAFEQKSVAWLCVCEQIGKARVKSNCEHAEKLLKLMLRYVLLASRQQGRVVNTKPQENKQKTAQRKAARAHV